MPNVIPRIIPIICSVLQIYLWRNGRNVVKVDVKKVQEEKQLTYFYLDIYISRKIRLCSCDLMQKSIFGMLSNSYLYKVQVTCATVNFLFYEILIDIKQNQISNPNRCLRLKKSHFDFIPRHIFKQFCLKYEIAVQSQNQLTNLVKCRINHGLLNRWTDTFILPRPI